jgi:hypothetical protein
MKPRIDRTAFGSITIEGTDFEHDVTIRLNGRPEKRKKKLSKAVYPQDTLKGCGTSHIISLAEAEHIFETGAERLIIGTGQNGMVKLSDEAADYFKHRDCQVKLLRTPTAIEAWNEAKGAVIGLFHVTC